MEYKGYTEYTFANDTEMANFYENMGENSLGLMINEYCLRGEEWQYAYG